MSEIYKKRTQNKVKRDIPVSFILFKSLTTYLISDNRNRHFVGKLHTFFSIVNTRTYEEDADTSIWYLFCKRYTDVVIEDNIFTIENILDKVLASPDLGEEFVELIDNIEDDAVNMSLEQALFVENEFISRLNMIAIFDKINKGMDIYTRFRTSDYSSFDSIINDVRISCTDILKSIHNKSTQQLDIPDLIFDDSERYRRDMESIISNINASTKVIRTGIKFLNNMLNGGWHPGRVYTINAATGGFKSGLMLNAVFWACKYNDNVRLIDQLKRPCALYINIENDNTETTERINSYVGAYDEEGKALSFDEQKVCLEKEKLLNNLWLMGILYRKKGSINTGDLDGIINSFESENNCEIKLLVVDYIKRIDPSNPRGDMRIDLGEVVNELSILAKSRQIPVITANQLNRAAYDVLDTEKEKNGKKIDNTDAGRKLNHTHLSESQLVAENSDVVIAVNKEHNSLSGLDYLTFKKLKSRGDKDNSRKSIYFAHPFQTGNGMRLMEDADLPKGEYHSSDSVSSNAVETIDNDEDIVKGSSRSISKSNTTKAIVTEWEDDEPPFDV